MTPEFHSQLFSQEKGRLVNKTKTRPLLAVQGLRLFALNAGCTGSNSVPGWGTKIPHDTWRGQKKEALQKFFYT